MAQHRVPPRPGAGRLRAFLLSLLLPLGLVSGAVGMGTAQASTGVFSVAAASDDAEQRPSSVDVSSSDLELVTDGGYAQTVGLRFSNVAIPQGATVTNAYIQFTSDEATTAATSLTIRGVDVSNPDTFTTAADSISKRSRTDASVPWTPPGWTAGGLSGVDQRTPNIAAIVQEVAARSSWVSGNPMALLIDGTGRRTAKAYEQGAATAPKLHVEWSTSTTPPPPPPGGPEVTLTNPADGSTVSGSVVLAAASPNASQVEYFVDGVEVAEDLTCCEWDEDWLSTSVADGPHELTAKATNATGSTTTPPRTITVSNTTAPPSNAAPVVNAGPDQAVTLPADATLDGTVTDDGLPAGSTLTTAWSKFSGPGTVAFGDATAVDTTAAFSEAGTYVLRLAGSDGVATTTDDVQVVVSPSSTPQKTNLRPSLPGAVGDNEMVNLQAGDVVTFNGDWFVENANSGGTVRIDWYIDNVQKAAAAYFATDPGRYGSGSQHSWTATEGTHVVKMTMDVLDTVDESDEADNSSTRTFTVAPADTPPPAAHPAPADHRAPGAPACPSNVVRPFPPGTTLNQQWSVPSPPDNITYDLTGVTSTAYPNGGASPFSLGNSDESHNICVNGGRLNGTTDDNLGWSYYHDQHNASCIRIVATGAAQANGLRCNDVEDGLKVLEDAAKATNLNVTTWYSSGVWLDRVRDDCMENDYTVGGVLHDSLWERCNSGLSERPSGDRVWPTPSNETIVLDHMLIGLWKTWHEKDGKSGHNAIFKWSDAGNKPVLKCSTFYVPEMSLNGADSMAIPPGTTIDDSACPNDPTTLVWGGGGSYPGDLNGSGIRVISDVGYWNAKVAAWKAAHGY